MQLRLRFDDKSHETVEAVEVGPDRFQLRATPVFAGEHIYVGDVIEATHLPDGTHRFVHVVLRAPMRHHSWLVPRSFVVSAKYTAFTQAVEAAGGSVESVLGGVLYAHVPESASFDAVAELDQYLKSDEPAA